MCPSVPHCCWEILLFLFSFWFSESLLFWKAQRDSSRKLVQIWGILAEGMLPAPPALVVEMDKRLATGALWLQWFSSPNHSILDQQDGCKSQQNLLHAEGKQSKNRSTDKLTKGLQCYKRKGSHKQQEENYIRKVKGTENRLQWSRSGKTVAKKSCHGSRGLPCPCRRMVRKSKKLSVLTLLFIYVFIFNTYSCFLQLSKKVSFKSRVFGRPKVGQGSPESIDVLEFTTPKLYRRWDIRKCWGSQGEGQYCSWLCPHVHSLNTCSPASVQVGKLQ